MDLLLYRVRRWLPQTVGKRSLWPWVIWREKKVAAFGLDVIYLVTAVAGPVAYGTLMPVLRIAGHILPMAALEIHMARLGLY